MILTSISEAQNRFYDAFDECACLEPYDYSSCLTVDEACMNALQETQNEYELYERALYEAEIEFVQENGRELVYTEAAIGDMVDKAVDAVKEWFRRIMGVLDRFMKEVASKLQVMRTKIFKANEKKIDAGHWESAWDFKDYDYVSAEVTAFINADLIGQNGIESMAKKYADKSDDYKYNAKKEWSVKNIKADAPILKELIDAQDTAGMLSVKDIKDKLLKETTVNKKYVSTLDPAGIIKGYAAAVKAVSKAKKDASKTTNSIIKDIKKSRSENSGKKGYEKDAYNIAIKAVGRINQMNTTIISAKLSILMGKLNQAYKVAGILTRSKGKIGSKLNNAGAKANDLKNKVKSELDAL